jgi:hypothetical protein
MRCFRQIRVADLATASRSIAAFGSGYKSAKPRPDISPVAAAEPREAAIDGAAVANP